MTPGHGWLVSPNRREPGAGTLSGSDRVDPCSVPRFPCQNPTVVKSASCGLGVVAPGMKAAPWSAVQRRSATPSRMWYEAAMTASGQRSAETRQRAASTVRFACPGGCRESLPYSRDLVLRNDARIVRCASCRPICGRLSSMPVVLPVSHQWPRYTGTGAVSTYRGPPPIPLSRSQSSLVPRGRRRHHGTWPTPAPSSAPPSALYHISKEPRPASWNNGCNRSARPQRVNTGRYPPLLSQSRCVTRSS